MGVISYFVARWYRYRSAKTAKYIKKIETKSNPEMSVREKIDYAKHPAQKKVGEILNKYKPLQ